MRRDKEDLILFGEKTGDIYGKIHARTLEQDKYLRKKREKNTKYYDKDSFTWAFDKEFEEMTKNLNEGDFVKLIYLATYINYDEKCAMYDNGHLITRDNLKEVLNLRYKQDSDKFLDDMIEAKLMAIGGGMIYFNRDVFWKGKLKKSMYGESSRMYVSSIRKLYMETPFKSHKKLAKFFRLVPYIHKTYGVLCKNVNEEDIHKVEILTVKEICEIMQCSYNNATKTLREICSVKLDGSPIMMFMTTGLLEETHVIVNPKIFYSGSYDRYVDALNVFFGNDKEDNNGKNK